MPTLYYSNKLTAEERASVIKQLPKRADYVEKASDNLFLPNYVMDYTRPGKGGLKYNILCFGVNLGGSKVCVLITEYKPMFDIKIPRDIEAVQFRNLLEVIIEEEGFYGFEFEFITGKSIMGYQEELDTFCRVTCNTLVQRKKLYNHLRENELVYINKYNNEISYYVDLFTDEMAHIYRAFCRQTKKKFGEWWELKNRNLVQNITKSDIKCYEISYKNIVLREDITVQGINDKTMDANWDLETISLVPDGRAPDPLSVYNADENKFDNCIFMNTISFFWHYSPTPLVVFNITDMPIPDRDDCIQIQVDNQAGLCTVTALIFERMCPDFIAGFNSDQYDWPFFLNVINYLEVKRRKDQISKLGLNSHAISKLTKCIGNASKLAEMCSSLGIDIKNAESVLSQEDQYLIFLKKKMSCLTATDNNVKWNSPGRTPIEIKLEGNDKDKFIKGEHFRAPGYIVIDLRTIFRKLYPRAEESNLNFFLKKEKLPLKTDMEYNRMFKIYIILKSLEIYYDTSNYYQILEKYTANPITVPTNDFNKYYMDPRTEFYIGNLSTNTILELIKDATLVVEYCNNDAISCHNLLRKRNIIKDNREWANLSYTTIADTFYYADGMKVRNVIMAEAEVRHLFCPINKNNPKSDKKYPGAYVERPLKGFYKNHINVKKELGEEASFSDRPMSDYDFSSLYPNIIITYNTSPEKIIKRHMPIKDGVTVENGLTILTTTFKYDVDTKDQEDKEEVQANIVQYNKDTLEGMGLYPSILRELYQKRKEIKALMGPYEAAKKILEKIAVRNPISREDMLGAISALLDQARITAETKNKKFYKKEYDNLIRSTEFINNIAKASYAETYDDVSFYFSYYNAKQLAIKIFMNTLYGDSGNSISPLFMVEIAGTITSRGRENLLLVKQFSMDNGFRVLYGDTDSVYMNLPDHYYLEVDREYESGAIDILVYWDKMIEITQDEFLNFQKKINSYLKEVHKTEFLAMECEGVAWPYMLCGKKKYIMLKHIGISNLDACKAATAVDLLNAPNLDIRGFEIKKRGSSQFLKNEFGEILRLMFNYNTTKSLYNITIEKFNSIKQKQYNDSDFIKSAKYNPPSAGKPGNSAVISFIARMRAILEEHPSIGITIPEPSDRFKYIIAKKYPYTYDLRGRKKKIGAGDKYEFFTSLFNEKYHAINGSKPEVDIDYYIEHEIIGQFARLLSYHFADNSIEDYEKQDDKAHLDAKKYLMTLFAQMRDMMPELEGNQKSLFTSTNKEVNARITKKFGEAANILNMTNVIVTGTDVKNGEFKKNICAELIDQLESKAAKIANKVKCPDIIGSAEKYNVSLTALYGHYSSIKRGFGSEKLKYIKQREIKIKLNLMKYFQSYQLNLLNYRRIIENSIDNPELIVDLESELNPDLLKAINNEYNNLVELMCYKKTHSLICDLVTAEYNKKNKIPQEPSKIFVDDHATQYVNWTNSLP